MRRFCPACEELLKSTHNHNVGCCAGCGWTGPWKDAYSEPLLPVVKPRLPYVSIDIETTGLDPRKCQTLEIGAAIDDWTKPIEELPLFRRVIAWEEVVGSPYAMAMNSRLLKSIGNKPRDPELPPKEALEKWLNSMAAGGPRYLPLDAILSRLGEEPIYWYEIPNRLLEMSVALPEVRALAGNPPETSAFCKDHELPWLFADWLAAHGINPRSVQAAGKNFASFDMQFLNRIPQFTKFINFRHRVLDPALLFWIAGDEKLPDSKLCYERSGHEAEVAHTAVQDALGVVWTIRQGVKRLRYFNG